MADQTLIIELLVDQTKAAAALKGLETQTVKTGRALKTTALTAKEGTARGFRNMGYMAQQASVQTGDFFIQVQGGQDVFRAFSQQATQVAGFFMGPWGIALTAASLAIGFFGEKVQTAIFGTGGVVDAEEAVKTFASSVSDTKAHIASAGESLDTLTEKYGEHAEAAIKASIILAKIDESNARRQGAEATTALTDTVTSVDKILVKYDTYAESIAEINALEIKTIEHLNEKETQLNAQVGLEQKMVELTGMNVAQSRAFANEAERLKGLMESGVMSDEFLDSAEALRAMVGSIDGVESEFLDLIDKMVTAELSEAELVRLAELLEGTVGEVADKIREATTETASWADAMKVLDGYMVDAGEATDWIEKAMTRVSLEVKYFLSQTGAPPWMNTVLVKLAQIAERARSMTQVGTYTEGEMDSVNRGLIPNRTGQYGKLGDVWTTDDIVVTDTGGGVGSTRGGGVSEAQRAEEERLKEAQKLLDEINKEVEALEENLLGNLTGAIESTFGLMERMLTGQKVQWQDFAAVAIRAIGSIIQELVKMSAMNALGMTAMGANPGVTPTAASPIADFVKNLLPFASGGIVTGPTSALIGEAGPEAVVPLTRGAGGKLGLAGGGTNVTVNNYTNSDVSVNDDGAGGIELIINAAVGEVTRQINRGGPVAQGIERNYGVGRKGR